MSTWGPNREVFLEDIFGIMRHVQRFAPSHRYGDLIDDCPGVESSLL